MADRLPLVSGGGVEGGSGTPLPAAEEAEEERGGRDLPRLEAVLRD